MADLFWMVRSYRLFPMNAGGTGEESLRRHFSEKAPLRLMQTTLSAPDPTLLRAGRRVSPMPPPLLPKRNVPPR